MKFVVDIDGTICNTVDGDYAKAQPYHDAIVQVNSLYDQGHKVVYFTARGMGRTDNDNNYKIGVVNTTN